MTRRHLINQTDRLLLGAGRSARRGRGSGLISLAFVHGGLLCHRMLDGRPRGQGGMKAAASGGLRLVDAGSGGLGWQGDVAGARIAGGLQIFAGLGAVFVGDDLLLVVVPRLGDELAAWRGGVGFVLAGDGAELAEEVARLGAEDLGMLVAVGVAGCWEVSAC